MKLTLSLLGAALLFLLAVGTGKAALMGLKEDRILAVDRRSSTPVSKDTHPGSYWTLVVFNGVLTVGFLVGGVFLIRRGFQRLPT